MKFHDKPGPIYGQQMLPESLPLAGSLMQACPSADELAQQSMRTAAAYEVAINHLLGLVGTLKRIAELADTGSDEHVKKYGQRLEGVVPGWRVAEDIREIALDALGRIGE